MINKIIKNNTTKDERVQNSFNTHTHLKMDSAADHISNYQ